MNLIMEMFMPSPSSTLNFSQPLLPFFTWEFTFAYLNNSLKLQFLFIFLSFNYYSLTSHYGKKGFNITLIDTHIHTHTTPLQCFLYQIRSDQFSCSVESDSLRLHELQHARPPCPSPTPGVHPNSCALSQWCHPAISSSVFPFSSCPQSLPASESFPKSQLFA